MQLVVDVLDLQGLTQVGDELAGLGDRQAEPLERLGILDESGHLGLDGGEVVLGEAASGHLDVVVNPLAVVGPKASRTPGKIRMIARAMMCAVECRKTSSASRSSGVRIRISIGAVVAIFERTVEVDDPSPATAATAASARRLPMPCGDLARADPVGIFLDRTIGQLDLDHRRNHLRSCGCIVRKRPCSPRIRSHSVPKLCPCCQWRQPPTGLGSSGASIDRECAVAAKVTGER